MLTDERVAALTAVRDGTVTARHANAPGSPILWAPREQTVALSFLTKANLVTVSSTYGSNRSRPTTVELTELGNRVLATQP